MKTLKSLTLIALVIGMFSFTACGQKKDVPQKVKTAFTQKFPDAQKVKWDMEEENEWEAEFKINGKEMTACYDNTGKWLETEFEVKIKDLPAEVFKAINLKFEGFEIEEAESIEKPDFKGYEILLEIEETEVEILVTSDGKLTIKDVKVEDEDDEDDDNDDDDDDDDDDNDGNDNEKDE
jgi:hypothetical protein